jgi:DNA-binding MarR family transcriptional regulator
MFFFFLDADQLAEMQARQFPFLDDLVRLVDVARAVDPAMSIGTLASFLHVVKQSPALARGDFTLKTIASAMGVAPSSLGRQVDLLCSGTQSTIRGLNLLEKGMWPGDRRQRQVRLTERGIHLLAELSKVLEAAKADPNISSVAKV